MVFGHVHDRPAYLAVGVALVAAVAVASFLPLTPFQSGLLVTLVVVVGGAVVVPGAWPTLYRKTGIGPGAWLLALAVAVGGIALSYAVGDPEPFCEGTGYRGCLTPHGFASALFLASCIGVAVGAGHLGRYRRVREASVEPAGEVREGPIAVEGRVVPASDTLAGPLSGELAVWYRSAVEAATPFGGRLETDCETAERDFYVEDGSGRLLVLTDRIDEHDAAELARSHTEEHGERRRREWRYEPNDAVCVVGHASEVSRAEYPEPIVVGLEGPVLVGLGRRDDLLAWAARRAVLGGALALVVGGLSLVGMLLAA